MNTPENEWSNIVNLNQLEFKDDLSQENYHYAESPQAASKSLGAEKLGFNVTKLYPGQFSCPYHFHYSEEELFLVLEGKAMLRQDGKYREIIKGDLVFFKNSPEGVHQIYNHTSEPVVYLALSTKDPMEVGEYPDSKKVFIRCLKKVIGTKGETTYWDGEEDPSAHWPDNIIHK